MLYREQPFKPKSVLVDVVEVYQSPERISTVFCWESGKHAYSVTTQRTIVITFNTHRFQPFQPGSEWVEKVDKPTENSWFPIDAGEQQTNKQTNNPTNQSNPVGSKRTRPHI